MKGFLDFIVSPVGERYSNEVKIGNKKLIVNSKIENFKSVNNLAKVISTPAVFKTNIKKGDLVLLHHNVFRRFYDIKGREKNSRSYFKDNKYLVSLDQIYLYKSSNDWKTVLDRCFVAPLKNEDKIKINNLEVRKGIIVYDNNTLNSLNIYKGDLVSYKKSREFEFVVDGKLLYCMKSNDILIHHEYEGNEKEYNPSWAISS